MHVKIAQEERHFKVVLRALLERFQGESGQVLLQKRGTLIIRGLCSMLGGIRVFRELATILEAETNCAFAASITQALNLMLLSAPELASLRAHLQRSQRDSASAHLLRTLYSCWCHSACAALSLCMLAEAYQHVGAMIHTLADLPLVPVLLAQVDRCAHRGCERQYPDAQAAYEPVCSCTSARRMPARSSAGPQNASRTVCRRSA